MKKRPDIAKILFIITMVLMFLPMLQQFSGLINFKPLKGVTNEVPKPVLSFDNYRSGKFQSQAEKYMSANFGFRQPFIRLYNQYIWTCYHKTNVESLVIGKDNWLYEHYFVDDYEGKRALNYADNQEELKKLLRDNAIRIRKLQEILEQYGKHLFVLVEPGKNRVYPEYLPDSCVKAPDSLVTAAEFYPYLFDSLGINNMNCDKWFLEMKGNVGFDLFPQTGTHWSNIASIYVTDSLIRYMEQLGGINMKNIVLGEQYIEKKAKNSDNDLEQMLNLMFTMHDVPTKFVDFAYDDDTTAVKPRMILIGDSFFWNIANNAHPDKVFENYFYWFYNSTIYFDSSFNNTTQTDIVDQLLNTDYVVLAACTGQLYAMDWGFTNRAILHLCYDQDEIDSVFNKMVEIMLTSPEWRASLQEKADAQGCTIEEKANEDANYLIYNYPERYFTELNDEHPTPRNSILEALSAHDDPVGEVLRTMLNNPKWMEETRQKAKENGQSVSETMLSNAKWVVCQRGMQAIDTTETAGAN